MKKTRRLDRIILAYKEIKEKINKDESVQNLETIYNPDLVLTRVSELDRIIQALIKLDRNQLNQDQITYIDDVIGDCLGERTKITSRFYLMTNIRLEMKPLPDLFGKRKKDFPEHQ